MEFKRVELYGGAMSVSLPVGLEDMSQWRQVPDHQEMWSQVETGATVIVELLERQSTVGNEEAAQYFYVDLAHTNGCNETQYQLELAQEIKQTALPRLITPPPPPSHPGFQLPAYCCTAEGTQLISKYTNETGKESNISISLLIVRYDAPIATDLLFSLSAPVWVHPESSDAKAIERVLTAEERSALLIKARETLEVHDWGLFAPSG